MKKKFIISILLNMLLAFAFGLFPLPWWFFAVTAVVIAIAIPQPPSKSFLTGFAALFLLWGIVAIKIDLSNNHLLSKKVAEILPLHGSYFLLILITAIIGGLIAGLASLTGSYVRKL